VPLGPLPAGVRPVRESLALDIDPANERFTGTAEIVLHLDSPRDHVWLHGRGLAVTRAAITLASGARLAARWDEVDPTGVARVAPVPPAPMTGDVTLTLQYSAAYDPQLVGAYRVGTRSGPAVFSKFEAIYARRAFPCFDEPAFKIPFDVAITTPAFVEVIGNMPVAEVAPVAGDPTHKRVRFQPTPPLPSYLVAFAVGPFDIRTAVLPPGAVRPELLPLRAVAMRGLGDATAYALAEEAALLAEQERYFQIRFPFPKLDLVAVPDFQSGAMENAGAITFRDARLLIDDQVSSQDDRVAVTSVLAHETAHQWFGDFVTMKWWDDLWLNEGFATFLDTKTLRAVRPQLEAELEAANRFDAVMSVDGLATARRICQPIETTHDITNAFDGITYEKGAAVLTMLEHYLGGEPFRRGLHDFLADHASGNATTDDLVRALSRASHRELGPLVGSFLEQPGVPVVTARSRCEAHRGRVELAQARWHPVGAAAAPDARWTIPVCVRFGIGERTGQACTVLDAETGSLDLPGCPDWIWPNADAAGYYRSALATEDLARLGKPHRLSTVERVQLGHDLEAAFASAALPGGDVLRALEPIARDPHGAVALVPRKLLGLVDAFIVDGPDLAARRKALRARITRLYAPAVAQLGFTPQASDSPWRRRFRTELLGFLALQIEDPAVLDEAARRGRRMLGLDRDHTRHPDAVAPDLADLALAAAARRGGADVFDALATELARSDDAQVRQRTLVALAQTRDPVQVGRALDLAFYSGLRKSERLVALRSLLGATGTRDVAWAWLTAHFDALAPLLPDRFGGQIPAMIRMCDARRIDEVRAFFAPRIDQLTGGPRNLAQALEAAAQCAARVAAQRDSVLAYLDAR
jgi:alanyl aminopeptidase